MAKDDAEFWSIIAESIDITKSEKSIEQMRVYGDMPGSRDEMISTAARNFYWAIMESELVALHEARKRGNPEARKVLKQAHFKLLLPFLSEFRDRGVFARHPSAILKENYQALSVLLAFKSGEKTAILEPQTVFNPKVVIFSLFVKRGIYAYYTLCQWRKEGSENGALPSLNAPMSPQADIY